jgi:glyoxylase-like metal-dependent hydrolase (beta-lactamase superfamily II)
MHRWSLALVGAQCFLGAAFAQAPAPQPAAVTTERVADDLHILRGSGGGQAAGNVLVFGGAQGVLLVDTGYPQYVPLYRDAIAKLGGGKVVYALNTHWHDDHSEGNKQFGPDDGATIVAQTNSRLMLTHDNKINVVRTILDQPAFPPNAWPAVTFDTGIELYFNGERIELVHFSPAHTAGDVAVIFRGHNVVHTGDVFLPTAYPFADVDNGGDFNGVIEFLTRLLEKIDRNTVVVPGHGRVASYDEIVAYVEMLKAVRERVTALIASGATLAQVVAAQPTKDWDAKYGNPTTFFLDRVYKTLAAKR